MTISYHVNNKNNSALLSYVETAINTGNINVIHLQKAKDAIDNAVDNCCFPRHKISKNSFLNTFYILLRGMSMTRKYNIYRLKAIQEVLNFKITCCTPA